MTPYQETPSFCFHKSICFLCQSSIYVPNAYPLSRPSRFQSKTRYTVYPTNSLSISHPACFVVLTRCDLGARVFCEGESKMKKSLSIVVVSLALAGCMGGKMGGVISGGQSGGQSITMNYEQGMSSDTYSTTIDGEYFEGKAVMVDATTTFGSAFGSAYNAYGATSLNTSGFAFSSSGKVKAILIGSRGSSLKCLMNYADSSGFTSAGGVGECIHSDGRQLDFVW